MFSQILILGIWSRMLGRNRRGQVAVEFILTFSVVIVLFVLIYRFSISLATVQLKQYITFMAGRAAASGTATYTDKQANIQATLDTYAGSTGSKAVGLVREFTCSSTTAEGSKEHQRGIISYNKGTVDFDVGSNAGLACMINISPLISNVSLVSEAMLGSDISESHCRCLLDFKKSWLECLDENEGVAESYEDNGC